MKKLFLTTILLCGSLIARADKPATHGMLVFGKQAIYASHLPMYHAPHDYQLLLKIKLVDQGNQEISKLYTGVLDSTKMFTLVPEKMDLTQIIDGTKTSFLSTLVEGHFEKGGKALGSVQVQVEKIIFSKKLDPSEKEESLDYIYFGEGGEYFAAHLIKGAPSFDSILKMGKAYYLKEHHCRTRACSEPSVKPVTDAALPMIFNKELFGQKAQAYKKGDHLEIGSFFSNTLAEVTDTVYWDDADLQAHH